MFSVFGISQLDSINTNSSPANVSAWKASDKTKNCYKKLFTKINPRNTASPTYMEKILEKIWPGAETTEIQAAYMITICEIMLSPHYDKITLSEQLGKSRLNKNLVSKIK
jgi:hypothetical protein